MLSKNIKKFRNQNGLSQDKLAKLADVTHTTLVKLESGANKNPTLETICKIANVFKISLDELVGRKR